MLVSVIIPNYNHSLYLKQRIDSVLNQSCQSFEIIILDDFSPDNSREVLEFYRNHPKVSHLIYNEQNSGSTFKQWNKGIALAQGKYIWIAESDDFADPGLLEKLVGKLEANPEVGLAYCDSYDVDDQNTINSGDERFFGELDPYLWKQDFILDGIDLVKKYMVYRNIIPNASAVVLRKKVVEETGLANNSFKINGDWVYWASILAKTKVAFVAEPLNYFRRHSNNVRSTTIVNGTSLFEHTRVINFIKKFGTPDAYFFDKMVRKIIEMWFTAMIEYEVPLKKHYFILRNLIQADPDFLYRFRGEFQDYMLPNKLSGLRRLLGDGIVYRIFKRNKR